MDDALCCLVAMVEYKSMINIFARASVHFLVALSGRVFFEVAFHQTGIRDTLYSTALVDLEVFTKVARAAVMLGEAVTSPKVIEETRLAIAVHVTC